MRRLGPTALCASLVCLFACGGGGGHDGSTTTCASEGVMVPDVTGSWLVHDLALASSDCSSDVADILENAIASSNDCVFDIAQDGARITAVECGGEQWSGCVDDAGNVTISRSDSESRVGCTVRVDGEIAANLSNSPAPGSLNLDINFSGTCALRSDCSAVVDATATEQTAASNAAAARTALPHMVLHDLLGQ